MHVMQKGAPLANLHMTLMDKFGVQVDKLGNSTGRLEGISESDTVAAGQADAMTEGGRYEPGSD